MIAIRIQLRGASCLYSQVPRADAARHIVHESKPVLGVWHFIRLQARGDGDYSCAQIGWEHGLALNTGVVHQRQEGVPLPWPVVLRRGGCGDWRNVEESALSALNARASE